jgi:TolA-binding protein
MPGTCEYPLEAVKAEQKRVRDTDKNSPFYRLKAHGEGIEKGMRWWRGELPGWVLEETKQRVEKNRMSADQYYGFRYEPLALGVVIRPVNKLREGIYSSPLEVKVDGLEKVVKKQAARVNTLEAEVEDLENEVESLNDQLESVEDQLAVSEKAGAELEATNKFLRERLLATGLRAHQAELRDSAAGNRANSLAGQLKDLQERNVRQEVIICNMDSRMRNFTGEDRRHTFSDYSAGGRYAR